MKINKIKIRKCKNSDIPAIKMIFREFVKHHVKIDKCFTKVKEHPIFFGEYIKDNLKNNKAIVYVADLNNEVIGYCLAIIKEKPPVFKSPIYGYIDNIAVLEKHQNIGIGEKLFIKAIKWFKKNHIQRIELFAAINNEKSTKFWRKMGLKTYLEQMYIDI